MRVALDPPIGFEAGRQAHVVRVSSHGRLEKVLTHLTGHDQARQRRHLLIEREREFTALPVKSRIRAGTVKFFAGRVVVAVGTEAEMSSDVFPPIPARLPADSVDVLSRGNVSISGFRRWFAAA